MPCHVSTKNTTLCFALSKEEQPEEGFIDDMNNGKNANSGGGSIGRVVTSYTRGPGFKSHWQFN